MQHSKKNYQQFGYHHKHFILSAAKKNQIHKRCIEKNANALFLPYCRSNCRQTTIYFYSMPQKYPVSMLMTK